MWIRNKSHQFLLGRMYSGTWQRRKIDPRPVFVVCSTIIVGRMEEQKEKLHKRSFALADCSQCCFYGINVKAEKEAIISIRLEMFSNLDCFSGSPWRSGSAAGNDQLIANLLTDRNYTWRDLKACTSRSRLLTIDNKGLSKKKLCIWGLNGQLNIDCYRRNNFFTALIAPFTSEMCAIESSDGKKWIFMFPVVDW